MTDLTDFYMNLEWANYLIPTNAHDWPRRYRRMFLLTLPISLPLWLLLRAAGFVTVIVVAVVGALIVPPFVWTYTEIRDLWGYDD